MVSHKIKTKILFKSTIILYRKCRRMLLRTHILLYNDWLACFFFFFLIEKINCIKNFVVYYLLRLYVCH